MSTVLSPTNKPPLHSRSGSQTARLASGIHLGIGPWSQTRDSKAVGGVECGPPCLPPEAPAGSRWLQCPQGGWAQRPRPQPSPGGTVQRPRPGLGGHMTCHHKMAQEPRQAHRPPTSLSATLAALWFLSHLFGRQTPAGALLLHSLQSPPALTLQTTC